MMKRTFRTLLWPGALLAISLHSAAALDPDLARFAFAKQNEAREVAKTLTNKVPAFVWSFFDAVRVDDWETATNLAARIQRASGRFEVKDTAPALQTPIWPSISETIGAYEQFHKWDNHWLRRFGKEIIDSIPRGSLYFGGTDSGRFIISALVESQREGKPFFVLTQNQLADQTYLEYLRGMYDGKIYTPTREDLRQVFEDYKKDAEQRKKVGKLKPGEKVETGKDGKTHVSGTVAVMEVNGLLVKIILEKNPAREFYIEESFAMDWMYPHLSPHGMIMKLQPEPLPGLREADVQKDHDYWKGLTGELVGGWITDETPVSEVCDFAHKTHLQKDRAQFKGDARFIENKEAPKTFSKLRASQAGLYAWRADRTADRDEKIKLQKAADLAFRQAIAFCPTLPEAVAHYTRFLADLKRPDDAILVAETARRLAPDDVYFQDLVRYLRNAN